MRTPNRFHYCDPFRLSPLGQMRAAVAWMRGPATMTRWLLLLFSACAVVTALGFTVELVMQAASPTSMMPRNQSSPRNRPLSQSRYVRPAWDMSHAGPSSSGLIDVPGISDCRPLPAVKWPPYSDPFGEPMVVVVDRSGVVWGPSCIVSPGRAWS